MVPRMERMYRDRREFDNRLKERVGSSVEIEAELLKELEGQSLDELRGRRTHERYQVRMTVVLRPGNSHEIDDIELEGRAADISRSGCQAVFSAPVLVGNVYRLQFDAEPLKATLFFARCVRCRLLREDAFEAGFNFFTPISLPGDVADLGDMID